MSIRKIDKNIGTVPIWGEDNFDANVHENFTSLKEIVPQVNNSIDDMNLVIEDLNSKIGTIDDSVVVTSQAKTDAVAAAEAAILAKNEAQAIYDNFDDRYLGPFLTPPTLDNDGQPLKNGALFYLYTESPEDKGNMYIYDLQRAEWIDISYIPTLFSSLTDILLAGLETGDILKYDKTLGKWQNIPRDYYNKTELDLKISYQQFDKPSKGPLFVKVSPSSIKIPAGLKLTVGTTSFKVITDYTLTLASDLVGSTKAAGTDYFVYAKADATFYISADDTIIIDRLIGGFHYGLVGETEAPSGEKTEEMMVRQRGIWAASCWDLKKRPSSKSPRAKNFAFGIWADIYPADEDIAIRGYSSPWKDPYATTQVKAKLAGGTTEFGRGIPKIPLAFKGNGTLTYGKLNHWDACEIAASLDMSLLSLAEFSLLAKGVLENVSSLTNAYETTMGTIEHYPNLTSEYLEQAAGVQWMWSSTLATNPTGDTWAYRAVTENRGQIYSTENSPIAVVLGGGRGDGVIAGSRASNWNGYVWDSGWYIGCRFACRDLELV